MLVHARRQAKARAEAAARQQARLEAQRRLEQQRAEQKNRPAGAELAQCGGLGKIGHGEKIGARVIQRARKKGAILRPLGPVIVLMPPLAMTEKELSRLFDITYDSIREITENDL